MVHYVGKVQWREPKAADHTVSSVRKQRAMSAHAQLNLPLVCSL